MPITITLPSPDAFLGLGASIGWSLDFGTHPSGSRFVAQVASDNEFVNLNWTWIHPTTAGFDGWIIGQTPTDPGTVEEGPNQSISDGTTMYLQVLHQIPAGGGTFTTDASANTSATWSNTQGAAILLNQKITQQPTTTLTTSEHNAVIDTLALVEGFNTTTFPSLATLLDTITAAVNLEVQTLAGPVPLTVGSLLGGFSLDTITSTNLTGGETCDPIDVSLTGHLYGVKLRITTVPSWVQFVAPGESWTISDLAVIRITRDGDLLLRHGVHTLQHTISPLPGTETIQLILNFPVMITGELRCLVDFAPGVCGELIGFDLPF